MGCYPSLDVLMFIQSNPCLCTTCFVSISRHWHHPDSVTHSHSKFYFYYTW